MNETRGEQKLLNRSRIVSDHRLRVFEPLKYFIWCVVERRRFTKPVAQAVDDALFVCNFFALSLSVSVFFNCRI